MKSATILENMNPCFKIDAHKNSASRIDIELLKRFSKVDIPEDYLSMLTVMTEIEILVNQRSYIRIWGPVRCVELNDAYHIQKYISNSLAIGDDEGGMAFIVMTGKQGHGIYKVGFGDLDAEDAIFIAPTLYNFFVDGIGVDSI